VPTKPTKIFDLNRKSCCDYVYRFDNIETFTKSFKADYDSIVAYHATKLNDKELKDLIAKGIRKGSKSLLYRKAVDRFVSPKDEEKIKKEIENEIDLHFKSFKTYTKTEINFAINRDGITQQSYHYLLFGPETLLPLADNLKTKFGISFRQRMADFGKSYLVTVAIPLKHVGNLWIRGIFEYLINGFPETSLVYQRQLPAISILKVSKQRRPCDRHFLLLL